MDGAAGVEHAALKRVDRFSAEAPRHRGHKARARAHGAPADVHQREAAGAVGVFRLPAFVAALPEERRLLIARRAADRNARERLQPLDAGHDRAVDLAVGNGPGEQAHGDTEEPAQLLVPCERVDVEEHCAAGVGVVGHMGGPAGETPDEPRFHRAEKQLAALGALPRAGNVVEQPFELRAGEVGIDDQTRLLRDRLRHARRFLELVADSRRAAALPDDGVVHRLTGRLVPQDRRLALVRDADARDVRVRPELAERLRGHAALALPELQRVMLDPAGLRVVLRKGLLRHRGDAAAAVEENGAGAGRALVERKDEIAHKYPLLFPKAMWYTKAAQ